MSNINLIPDTHKYYLTPSGATQKNNSTFNSSLKYDITNPVSSNPNIVYSTIRILHAEIPYSFYIVNQYNNYLALTTGNITIPVGNYNANTFMTQLNSQLPSGMVLSFATSTGKFSLSYNSSFSINTSSTCGIIMGFTNGASYSSSANSISLPYPCNLLGTKNLYVKLTNFIFDNINTYTKDKTTLANIQVNVPSYSLIMFNNKTVVGTIIKNDHLPNYIDLEIRDDYNNLVDFNNIEFNITLELTHYIEISDMINK